MPMKRWKHECAERGRAIRTSEPVCDFCGGCGEYDGWHYTPHEAAARYQTLYHLKATGGHRRLADEIFAGASYECAKCGGRGLWGDGDRWSVCEVCGGLGELLRVPAADFERRRRRVLAHFPGAGAEPVPRFRSEVGTGTMVPGLHPEYPFDPDPESYEDGQGDPEADEGGAANSEPSEHDPVPGAAAVEYADPWTAVDPAAFAASIDRVLVDDPAVPASAGRVLVPEDPVSIVSAVLAAIPDAGARDRAARDIEENSVGVGDVEEVLSRFCHPRWVFRCEVLDSMVSGQWGLMELRIGDRGYLYNCPDIGVGADESLPVLGAWAPAEDAVARRTAVLAVHAREWQARGWPPWMCQYVSGELPLIHEAVVQALGSEARDGMAWMEILDAVAGLRGSARETAEGVATLVEELSVPQIQCVLDMASARDEQFLQRCRAGETDEDELRILAALLVHAIGGPE